MCVVGSSSGLVDVLTLPMVDKPDMRLKDSVAWIMAWAAACIASVASRRPASTSGLVDAVEVARLLVGAGCCSMLLVGSDSGLHFKCAVNSVDGKGQAKQPIRDSS